MIFSKKSAGLVRLLLVFVFVAIRICLCSPLLYEELCFVTHLRLTGPSNKPIYSILSLHIFVQRGIFYLPRTALDSFSLHICVQRGTSSRPIKTLYPFSLNIYISGISQRPTNGLIFHFVAHLRLKVANNSLVSLTLRISLQDAHVPVCLLPRKELCLCFKHAKNPILIFNVKFVGLAGAFTMFQILSRFTLPTRAI